MKNLLTRRWSRYALAALAGLLLASAFPNFNVAGFAWIAPALLLAAARGRSGRETFLIGCVGGVVSTLAQYFWLLNIPVKGFPVLGWVALSAYLGLFPAVWVWLNSEFGIRNSELENTWVRRSFRALAGAAAWVALEMLRARLFGGMPWNLLGVSQFRMTPLIQFAAVTGVYGVSFLVAWSSLALLNAVDVICRDPLKRLAWQAEIILPLAVVMAAFIHGTNQLHVTENKSAPVANVTFIQPSIPQAMIWNDAEDGRRFAQLLDLTRTALSQDTDLLLWPEAALPNVGQAELTALTDLVHERRVWMILGADDSHFGPGGVDYFNAAVLLNPRGESAGVYHKRKLVMFGEYVPASRWLPFLKHLTPISGGFTPGEHPVQFRLERRSADGKNISSSGLKTSTLICFEDIFPDLVRGYVDDDTDFLVNITNNGWFGEGAAQWQHAAATVFRAVENGVPLLRCANNGVTCWVDERGRIREVFHDAHGTIYGAGAMTAHIPLRAPGSPRVQTFYNRHGDWFGWVCVGVASLSLLARIVSLRRAKREAV